MNRVEHNPVFVNGYPATCEANGLLPFSHSGDDYPFFKAIFTDYPPEITEQQNRFIPVKIMIGFKCCLCGVEFYYQTPGSDPSIF